MKYLPFLLFLFLASCSNTTSPEKQFYGVSDQDAAYCRLQVAQAMGPSPESLSGTLNQLGTRNALMRDCLISKGYVAQ